MVTRFRQTGAGLFSPVFLSDQLYVCWPRVGEWLELGGQALEIVCSVFWVQFLASAVERLSELDKPKDQQRLKD